MSSSDSAGRGARPIYRAPMRPRDRDTPPGAGAEFGLEHGVVGIGDVQGEKGERMLRRFSELPDGSFVWTRVSDGSYRLGQIAGARRRDDSPAASEVGIHNVRPAAWLDRPLGDDEVPTAVADTFARGGRNFQRTHDELAERETAKLWDAYGPSERRSF
jgi:hypothetical protein